MCLFLPDYGTTLIHIQSIIQYCTHFAKRKPSAIIDHSFALATRLVHFRSAPALFMVFSRIVRQNPQNLSKSSVIPQIPQEHTLRCENVQYTDESITN